MNKELLNVVAEMINYAQKEGKVVSISLDADMSKRVADLEKKEKEAEYHDDLLKSHSRGGFYTLFHNSEFEKYKTKRNSLRFSEKIEADKFHPTDLIPFEIGLKKRMNRGASILPYSSKELLLYDLYQTLSAGLPIIYATAKLIVTARNYLL